MQNEGAVRTPEHATVGEGMRRRTTSALLRAMTATYTYVFGRPSMQPLNNAILNLALHGRGYNNFATKKLTGEEHLIRRLARHKPALCVDVGANKGDYTARLLALTDTKVIAFEPLPAAFRQLRALESAFPGRLYAINKGVGDRNSHLDLHYGDDDSEFASLSSEVSEIGYVGQHNINSMKVEVTTLDSYFAGAVDVHRGEIDLLKIDTEGYEYEVLAGAADTLKRLRPKFVQIEYNWHQLFRKQSLHGIASLLTGYVAYQLLPYGSGLSRVDVRSPEANIYHFSNFVFVRQDVAT
jgi:FkbM family methyltransferase